MLKKVVIVERWHSFRPLSRSSGAVNTDEIASLRQCYEEGENICKLVLKNGYEMSVIGVAADFINEPDLQC